VVLGPFALKQEKSYREMVWFANLPIEYNS